MRRCGALLVGAMVTLAGTSALPAQQVTLTSRDGSLAVDGTLLDYDGEFFRIDTAYGELVVDGGRVACDGAGCPDIDSFVARIAISGAPAIGDDLLPALIEAFAAQEGYDARRVGEEDDQFSYVLADGAEGRPVAEIGFRVSSSEEGFADLLADEADIALSVREARPIEVSRALETPLGDLAAPRRSRVIALDALIPVVAPGHPVDAISIDTLADIFAGRIETWEALGGPDAPIALHLLNEDAGLAQRFVDTVMEPAGRDLAATVMRHDTTDSLAAAVAADPLALGMATLSDPGNTKTLALRGSCGFSLTARADTLQAEDYPLTAPLFAYLPARRLPAVARDLLDFVQSPRAQIVVRRAGFVDQGFRETGLRHQGDRLANAIAAAGAGAVPLSTLERMVARLQDARRLSISFRFEGGSSALDAQSRSNVVLLADALEAGIFDRRRLVFVGFSDGEGGAQANLDLSRQRAEAVRDAVLAEAATVDRSRLNVATEAFGEAMPMACDDTAWGRQVNRRVEVWLR